MLRLPDGMRDRIADAAKANNRSMNAEIVSRLEETFGQTHIEEVRTTKTLMSMVDKIVDMLRANGWRPPDA